MTEKRFEIDMSHECLKDNEKELSTIYFSDSVDFYELCEVLNALHEENQRLKLRVSYVERKIQRERTSAMKEHEKWEKEILKENEQLKKELLFFYDVANCECSTNWRKDMEKGCKRFFNCTYKEAKEKYGDYDGMWWEIND